LKERFKGQSKRTNNKEFKELPWFTNGTLRIGSEIEMKNVEDELNNWIAGIEINSL